MRRTLALLALGLLTGALAGLLAGGLIYNFARGHDPNASGVFVMLTDFPGLRAVLSPPWALPWQITGASSLVFGFAAVLFSFRQQLTEYGQAHFQSRIEMKMNGLLQPLGAGLLFGKLSAPAKPGPYVSATFQKFPHCLVVAPTRAGKGVGYVIPNTLMFNGSCVILDVKGEIFEATSRHRQAEGDAVFRFSPFDFEHPTHRYNPLERVSRIANLEQRYTELAKISDYFLTVSDKGTAGDFLTEGRELFVAAGLLAIERGRPTLGEISRILFGQGATSEIYGQHAEEVTHPNAAQTFRKFAGYSDRTLSSHASVLGGAGMTLWNNPAVDRATSANDFSFGDLRKTPTSIYVVVNADDIRTLAPLIRLFFGELIATMRATLPHPEEEPWPVMILLDEFDQLGPMPIVEQALKQLAGHGARVSIITQSIPGLDNIYGENIRMSLESAAGMKLYLAANDKKTADEISNALGKTTKLAVSDSLSRDRDFVQRRSVSRRMEERPLLMPDEIRRLDADQAILIPERQNPLLVSRIVYFQDPTFLKIFEAQTGPLPYTSSETAEVQGLAARLDAMERKIAALGQIEYVRKGAAQDGPKEPSLAAALVAPVGVHAPRTKEPEASPDLAVLTPAQTVAMRRMAGFEGKLAEMGA
ncbi:type IV secretory system conjugative DNA transfer family protein [Stagnihabitans tardus]|uniref:Type IV secretory system conjugative DNA transfer family protein n=1 Tax=Stagnihabitans tardus TaxID=2699202 RepID=A0AAE4YFX6_9RHOB|nr:type IV secretory system conjugative DNA transfer family protein [Stagnihabitans tardus]NBZ89200.1 type IV secretory system conjugative DNA transfer family protein [Stagnihabitans tardus]